MSYGLSDYFVCGESQDEWQSGSVGATGDWRQGVCWCKQSEQEGEQQQGCLAGLTAEVCCLQARRGLGRKQSEVCAREGY